VDAIALRILLPFVQRFCYGVAMHEFIHTLPLVVFSFVAFEIQNIFESCGTYHGEILSIVMPRSVNVF
jgi:hypothetical protein